LTVLEGAERYVRRDFKGAARAWRPLIRTMGGVVSRAMRHALVDAFDHAGDADLAEKIDAPVLAQAGPFNGADLAYVRAARRAEKRGDHAKAKEWARKVVDAWSIADEPVPTATEMKALAAR
jgi:hypothetical protein